METKEVVLARIVKLVQNIQKESKIGTAYERYDTQHLWDLGELIRAYGDLCPKKDDKDSVGEIVSYVQGHSVRCPPLLLKNAETARRTWPTRELFLKMAKDVSYGKLKAVLPIFDPEFISWHNVSTRDLDRLSKALGHMTYEDVLNEVRKIREKYDPNGVSIDLDVFYDELYSAIENLRQMVETQHGESLSEFRERLSPKFVENSRRLMAAMKSEEMFERLANEVPKNFGREDAAATGIEGHLRRIVCALSQIRQAPTMRQRLRDRIGIAKLGELSTLLKAASTDEDLNRYIRGQKLLAQIRVFDAKAG